MKSCYVDEALDVRVQHDINILLGDITNVVLAFDKSTENELG